MKTQFGHSLSSSFYLWVDDRITRFAEGVFTGKSQIFSYSSAVDTPSGFNSFFSPKRQFCAGHELSPSGVFVNGTGIEQSATGQKMLIDHDQGRILLDSSFGTSVTVSGNFVEKEINVYESNESQEELIINKDFVIAGDTKTFLETKGQQGQRRYTLPAVFVTDHHAQNKGLCFGGIDETKAVFRVLVVGLNKYQIDGILSLFTDAHHRAFGIIRYEDFPYGPYWYVKEPPYSYPDLISNNTFLAAHIESVTGYKLKDAAQAKLGGRSLFFGFLDFQLKIARTEGDMLKRLVFYTTGGEASIQKRVRLEPDSDGRCVVIVDGVERARI